MKFKELPIIREIHKSIGIQRSMLVVGLGITVIFILTAIFASVIAPYGFGQIEYTSGELEGEYFGKLQPPSELHWWGTTIGSMDVFSRVIWGAQTALIAIIASVLASIFLGIFLGLISGYFGGWLDRVLVVICDAIYAFPSLLLAIIISIVITNGAANLLGGIASCAISMTVVYVPQYYRVTRAEVLVIKSSQYVDAAKIIGTPTVRILFKHVLANSTRTLPVIFTLNCSEAILTLAGLGFLGFGIEPTSASEWGYDLNRAISDITNGTWWTAIFPGIAIVLVVLGITLVGESLNDISDPKLRQKRKLKSFNFNRSDAVIEDRKMATISQFNDASKDKIIDRETQIQEENEVQDLNQDN